MIVEEPDRVLTTVAPVTVRFCAVSVPVTFCVLTVLVVAVRVVTVSVVIKAETSVARPATDRVPVYLPDPNVVGI